MTNEVQSNLYMYVTKLLRDAPFQATWSGRSYRIYKSTNLFLKKKPTLPAGWYFILQSIQSILYLCWSNYFIGGLARPYQITNGHQ